MRARVYFRFGKNASRTVIPYIHIGDYKLPTYGMLVFLACVAAWWVLRAELKRRGVKAPADLIISLTVLAGLAGAKLYHVLETPSELMADPKLLISPFGFAWFGGLLAGITTLYLLARHYGLAFLTMLDLCSPAAALGYGVGRIGCLTSGDGDYGIPTSLPWGMSFPNGLVPTTERVHPTPIYEFFFGVILFWYLWKLGRRALRGPRPVGEITGEYLLWSGAGRFLVEFIRINPRSVFGALTNAQAMSLASMIAGIALVIAVKRHFKTEKQEHRIARHSSEKGDVLQAEYHQATPECPHPERWHMYDSMTAEIEVLDFLKSLVTTLKPERVVETGTFMGLSTIKIAEGLKENGLGRVITCEFDPVVYKQARARLEASGLMQFIEARNQSSLEMTVDGPIDLLFCDSALEVREQEVRRFLPQVRPYGLIVMHDASSHLKTVREAALRMEREGLLSVLLLPTPRGLVLAQKREGRS